MEIPCWPKGVKTVLRSGPEKGWGKCQIAQLHNDVNSVTGSVRRSRSRSLVRGHRQLSPLAPSLANFRFADHPPGISVSLQVEDKQFIGNGHLIAHRLGEPHTSSP
jgi:hypothetical protein